MPTLFKDLKGWLEYNYEIRLNPYQEKYLEAIFKSNTEIPETSKELEKRLGDFLPKKTK